MKNEFDKKGSRTKNFLKQQQAMSEINVSYIVKVIDCIHQLARFIPYGHEVLDTLDETLEPLNAVIKVLETGENCPHCAGPLYMSDLPQYDSVCPICEENF